jgi:pimeloyl-ACP methyl ester carboxylesterase
MKPSDFKHHNITINNLNYHYVRQGSGAPLLLIHGWPGFWYEWHMNIGPLSERFDVVAPDMRGITAPTDAETLRAAIPGAKIAIVPDAGHMSPMEQPDAVNSAIRSRLAGRVVS